MQVLVREPGPSFSEKGYGTSIVVSCHRWFLLGMGGAQGPCMVVEIRVCHISRT